ncbi:hypothetical protein HDU92_000674 [Lobulomyces angularis]|nr:hypothetical protein HDU92_000674 [Lobulomyces angularis]
MTGFDYALDLETYLTNYIFYALLAYVFLYFLPNFFLKQRIQAVLQTFFFAQVPFSLPYLIRTYNLLEIGKMDISEFKDFMYFCSVSGIVPVLLLSRCIFKDNPRRTFSLLVFTFIPIRLAVSIDFLPNRFKSGDFTKEKQIYQLIVGLIRWHRNWKTKADSDDSFRESLREYLGGRKDKIDDLQQEIYQLMMKNTAMESDHTNELLKYKLVHERLISKATAAFKDKNLQIVHFKHQNNNIKEKAQELEKELECVKEELRVLRNAVEEDGDVKEKFLHQRSLNEILRENTTSLEQNLAFLQKKIKVEQAKETEMITKMSNIEKDFLKAMNVGNELTIILKARDEELEMKEQLITNITLENEKKSKKIEELEEFIKLEAEREACVAKEYRTADISEKEVESLQEKIEMLSTEIKITKLELGNAIVEKLTTGNELREQKYLCSMYTEIIRDKGGVGEDFDYKKALIELKTEDECENISLDDKTFEFFQIGLNETTAELATGFPCPTKIHNEVNLPIKLEIPENVSLISVGGIHILYADEERKTVYQYGEEYAENDNENGRFLKCWSVDDDEPEEYIMKLEAMGAVSIVLTSLGRVYAWGGLKDDQAGYVQLNIDNKPINLSSSRAAIDVAASESQILVLMDDGSYMVFGIIVGTGELELLKEVHSGEEMRHCWSGENNLALINDKGECFVWGNNYAKFSDDSTIEEMEFLSDPIKLNLPGERVNKITFEKYTCLVKTEAGNCYVYGTNHFTNLDIFPLNKVHDIASGHGFSAILTEENQIIYSGLAEFIDSKFDYDIPLTKYIQDVGFIPTAYTIEDKKYKIVGSNSQFGTILRLHANSQYFIVQCQSKTEERFMYDEEREEREFVTTKHDYTDEVTFTEVKYDDLLVLERRTVLKRCNQLRVVEKLENRNIDITDTIIRILDSLPEHVLDNIGAPAMDLQDEQRDDRDFQFYFDV